MKTLLCCLVTAFLCGCGSASQHNATYYSNDQHAHASGDLRYAPARLVNTSERTVSKLQLRNSEVSPLKVGSSYANASSAEEFQQVSALNSNRTEPTPIDIPEQQRMVAYTASLNMAVDSVQFALKQITTISSRYQGYVESSTQYSMTIRVSAGHFDEALHDIVVLGTVDDKYTNAVDVSEQFYDLETRLNTAENSRKRYLELLAKAENVEAALKVEHELERVTETIESMKAQRERLKTRFMLSEITVVLRALHPQHQSRPGPLGYVAIGLYKAVEWLFVWH